MKTSFIIADDILQKLVKKNQKWFEHSKGQLIKLIETSELFEGKKIYVTVSFHRHKRVVQIHVDVLKK